MTLFRGGHQLPHQCQMIKRDLDAEKIARTVKYGKTTQAFGFRRTPEQIADTRRMPYEYLISAPSSAGLSWTAFYTRQELQTWLDAYGCTLDREPVPGSAFYVQLPADEFSFAELVDDGAVYGR